MRLSHALLALLGAMWIILGAIFFVPGSPTARGYPHRQVTDQRVAATTVGLAATPMGRGPLAATSQLYPDTTLASGGVGYERHAGLVWYGWAFATVQVIFFSCLLALGVQRQGKANWLSLGMLLGGLLFLVGIAALFFAYRDFLNPDLSPGEIAFLGPLPAATSLAILGVTGVPIVFVILYIAFFPNYVWTKDDEAKCQQLIAQQATTEGSH